jgi:hypothetical protein
MDREAEESCFDSAESLSRDVIERRPSIVTDRPKMC